MAYSVFNQGLGSAVKKGATAIVKATAPPKPSTPTKTLTPIQGLGSAFKAGAYNLTDKGSGGAQAQARQEVRGAPTSYSSGTKVSAATPAVPKQIPVVSLMGATSPTSKSSYAGTPLTLPSSAPSTAYNYSSAIQGNIATGANPETGLYETQTTPVTPTTGKETAITTGQSLLKAYGIPEPEKPQSITEAYYDSPLYKASLKAAEKVNQTQNAINAITTRLNTDLANLRGVGAKEGVTEAVYGQQTSQIIREANNQLLPLQAQLAADQGNLELAQTTLTTWANLLGRDVENEYNYKKSIRDELVKFATDDQKRRLDAAQRKEDQAFELKKLDIQFQYDKKLKQIGLGSEGISDPAQLVAYAQQYASTGTIPTGMPKGSFGAVSLYAKEMPKAPGQILDRATGVTPDKLGAAGDAYGALYSAIELSKQLKALDEKRIGGLVSGALGKVFGSTDQAKYVDLRTQIVDLLARARSGAALTQTEEERYSDMLPSRWSNPLFLGTDSQTRIDNFTNALTSDLTNKANSKGWVVNGISKINLNGKDYTVGDVIEINGARGRINADGSVTQL